MARKPDTKYSRGKHAMEVFLSSCESNVGKEGRDDDDLSAFLCIHKSCSRHRDGSERKHASKKSDVSALPRMGEVNLLVSKKKDGVGLISGPLGMFGFCDWFSRQTVVIISGNWKSRPHDFPTQTDIDFFMERE